jgi:cyclic lactone autoinducer peptide
MDGILAVVASVIEKVAELGAGLVSGGVMYQPKLPDELLDAKRHLNHDNQH